MSAIDDLFAQLERDSAALDDPLLGLASIGNDNLSRPALDQINAVRDRMQDRKRLIAAFVLAGRALVGTGYPAPIRPTTDATVTSEILRDERVILIATELFHEAQAQSLGLQANLPVPKES